MAIRTPSAPDLGALFEHLHSTDPPVREAAVARLRVLGARARQRALTLLADTSAAPAARTAALQVMEALDDRAVMRAAIVAAADASVPVAVAALHLLRTWLDRDEEAIALQAITEVVTDETRPVTVRRAALDALSDLPSALIEPLRAQVGPQLAHVPPLDDAGATAAWLLAHGDAPLNVLHEIVTAARDRQTEATGAEERAAWLDIRAAAHSALAHRGSQIALYDAREIFEKAEGPLPLDLLVTMRTIGTVECLESLARSWEAAIADPWWRGQLQAAAAAIMKRERVSSRNAVVKRVRAKWPDFVGGGR